MRKLETRQWRKKNLPPQLRVYKVDTYKLTAGTARDRTAAWNMKNWLGTLEDLEYENLCMRNEEGKNGT